MHKLFALLDDMTPAQLRGLLVVGVVAGVTAAFSALGLSIYGASNAGSAAHNAAGAARRSAAVSKEIRTLLLDGKTASAISAKKTAKEVKLLIDQQAFDHQQTVNAEKQAADGQTDLKAIVREVETHLDATIRTQVNQAAEKVAKEFGQ